MTAGRLDGVVLVIEGDDSIRQMLAALLGGAGFTTHCVAADDTAATLDEERFDVIVRDVSFLPPDGDTVLQKLEQSAPELLRRTVITTTSPAALLNARALERPFAVVQKPFDIDLLVETVRRCRDRARRRGGRARKHKTARQDDELAGVDLARIQRFVGNLSQLHALLAREAGSLDELFLRNALRRTALELAHVLDEAARRTRSRSRAAILLGAANFAARLAGRDEAVASHTAAASDH